MATSSGSNTTTMTTTTTTSNCGGSGGSGGGGSGSGSGGSSSISTSSSSGSIITGSENNNGNSVPQWKRDLIQRRRQQNKVLANNGASIKLCSAVIGSSATTNIESKVDASINQEQQQCIAGINYCIRTRNEEENSGTANNNSGKSGNNGNAAATAVLTSLRSSISGASSGRLIVTTTTTTLESTSSSVACNMRLETEVSLDADDVLNGVNNKPLEMEQKELHFQHLCESNTANESNKKVTMENVCLRPCNRNEKKETTTTSMPPPPPPPTSLCPYKGIQMRSIKDMERNRDDFCADEQDNESDSSEELQYGPGIVNRLKSKYLNLTLREMNNSRVSVQRFRRAASLEDLLDCDEPLEEKPCSRKFTKRNAVGASTASKTDRYRNAARGNESMKRARSVETLMRYNTSDDVSAQQGLLTLGLGSSTVLRQDPVNDHIILIDRTSVKIESRLREVVERPKAINKPKRIKPILAETERPPPDLVKTTMRIFEGSAKKLKPKGEVAAKVATFKTINDTFKAQNQKKLVPKPPIQPKPFINGKGNVSSSPKKILVPTKPMAELIEKGLDDYHNDGVITESIVQSVSSVVSKFQQIEKSYSPTPSPEPSLKLLKSFSPSPELKTSLEINVKSPPVTPVPSPRVSSSSSPKLTSPVSSPKKEQQNCIVRQNSSPVHRSSSPNKELLKQISAPESPKLSRHESNEKENVENDKIPDEKDVDVANDDSDVTCVDSPLKSISKSALDNIGKAGTTMQFSFNGKSNEAKSYLPGVQQNGEKISNNVAKENSESPDVVVPTETLENTETQPVEEPVLARLLQERLEPEKSEKKVEESSSVGGSTESKPLPLVGAISSLGLLKSTTTTTTTTTSHPQGNETKTIKCQKIVETTSSTSSLPSPPPPKQIGIIRPLVSTKTQLPQQNLSSRELEKNLINRVKSIEQPTKVVVSLKSADEIQPVKKSGSGSSGAGLWDTKPWNQQNNTMVFNFSNRKDVPDYIENDGLIIRRKREKPKVGDSGIIVLDATLDTSSTDDADWEISGGPPSPCDVSFLNDNILINGRSNLSRQPRNHKHRIQFDDTATRTFEYPSEASMLEGESSNVDGETSACAEQSTSINNRSSSTMQTSSLPSLLGGGGLASYTPSKVDLTTEGFELGVTRSVTSSVPTTPTNVSTSTQPDSTSEVDYLKPAQDAGAWGSETTGDLLY